MLRKTLFPLVLALCAGMATATLGQVKEIRWGTSQVGSTGHRAVVNLAELLNKQFEGYHVTVQPTPGAILTVKGYATGQFEGYYGSDIAFYELANNIKRFEGFKENMTRQPVQSFWAFTVEVGLGIHARDRDKIEGWSDLSGKRLFTGPRPWDTRAQAERALEALGIEFDYFEVDIATAGSLLDAGRFAAMTVYANAEATTAPWIIEASLQTDWAALNPSEEEIAKLKKAGFSITEVPPKVFNKDNLYVDKVVLLPFYYGLHVGLEMPEDDLYRMLMTIEENVQQLAQADKGFAQVAADMPGMQRRGVEAAANLVPIHPGLARYMREKGVWDSKWDSRVAMAQ